MNKVLEFIMYYVVYLVSFLLGFWIGNLFTGMDINIFTLWVPYVLALPFAIAECMRKGVE